jgi:hypothetical protein
MVAIYCAYSQQINPAGVTPVLTRAQIWKALQRKIRRAQDFVPVISDCTVLEDKGNIVVREAKFIDGGIPGQSGKTIREVCKSYAPVKVRGVDVLRRGRFWDWEGADVFWMARSISISPMERLLPIAYLMGPA